LPTRVSLRRISPDSALRSAYPIPVSRLGSVFERARR